MLLGAVGDLVLKAAVGSDECKECTCRYVVLKCKCVYTHAYIYIYR